MANVADEEQFEEVQRFPRLKTPRRRCRFGRKVCVNSLPNCTARLDERLLETSGWADANIIWTPSKDQSIAESNTMDRRAVATEFWRRSVG